MRGTLAGSDVNDCDDGSGGGGGGAPPVAGIGGISALRSAVAEATPWRMWAKMGISRGAT